MKNEVRTPITISRKQAAELCGLAVGTLANISSRREGPLYYKRGRAVLYDYQKFVEWVQENPVLTKDSLDG